MNYLTIIVLILFGFGFAELAQKSDELLQYCANEDCSEPIAVISIKQPIKVVDHESKLKVDAKDTGDAYEKPVTKDGYWHLKINGKMGYVQNMFVRIEKTLINDSQCVKVKKPDPFLPSTNEDINPTNRVVIQGTTMPAEFMADENLDNISSSGDIVSPTSTMSTPLQTPIVNPSANHPSGSTNTDSSSPFNSQSSNAHQTTAEDNESKLIHDRTPPDNADNANKKLLDTESKNSSNDSEDDSDVTVEDEHDNSSLDKSNLFSANQTDINLEKEMPLNGQSDSDKVLTNSIQNNLNNPSESVSTNVSNENSTSNTKHFSEDTMNSKHIKNEGNLKPLGQSSESTTNHLPIGSQENATPGQSSESTTEHVLTGSQENASTDPPDLSYQEDGDNSPKTPGHSSENTTEHVSTGSQENATPGHSSESTTEHVSTGSQENASTDPPDRSYQEDGDNSPKTPGHSSESTTEHVSTGSQENASTPPPDLSYQEAGDTSLKTTVHSSKSPTDHFSTGSQENTGPTSPFVTESSTNALEESSSTDVSQNVNNLSNNEEAVDYLGDQFNGTPTENPGVLTESKSSSEKSNGVVSPENIAESSTIPSHNQERNREQPSSVYGYFDQRHSNQDNKVATVEDITENPKDPSFSEPTTETSLDSQEGWFSSFGFALVYFENLFTSSQLPETPVEPDVSEVTEPSAVATETTAQHGYCYDKSCGGLERPVGIEDRIEETSEFSDGCKPMVFVQPEKVSPLSMNTLIYITVTSVVILIFSLGYYYIDSSQNSGSLIAKVNVLSQELFVVKKEKDSLEEHLLKIKDNYTAMDNSIIKQDSKVALLQDELKDSENARRSLEEMVARLEKEVETLMDNGMEMHRLLSESISDEERSQMLLANIDELKESLNARLSEIVSLTEQIDEKNNELQMLNLDLRNANEKQTELERKLKNSRTEVENEMTKTIQDLQKQIIKLQELVDEKNESEARQEKELVALRSERDVMRSRAKSAESGLAAAHGVKSGDAREAWLDVTRLRAEAELSAQKISKMEGEAAEAASTNAALLDKISGLHQNLSELNSKYESAEREKVNAFTKLQVLSDYFKEKENKLQEELGTKESLWLQKESEDHTIYEQMKSLRDEVSHLKSQNESLKLEIVEQERSHKALLQAEEQKMHENWVALRQTERKYKELQVEAAHYRNRLTQLEASSSGEKLNPALLEVGAAKGLVGAPSPPFVMLPPPPEPFPLDPMMALRRDRPPPLGRISSPPLGADLPPPPLVNFDFIPPPSSTPPPPLFHPQPRDRPPKDSPPSNYSSESIGEKTSRRRR